MISSSFVNKIGRLFLGEKRSGLVDSTSNRFVLSLTHFLYFSVLGIFVPYVGVYLDYRGFSSSQIGILLAFVAASRIFGPVLWANIADKSGRVGEVLRLGCLLAFLVFIGIFWVDEFWLLTLIFSLMMMFWTAVLPQLEVTTVLATINTKGGYGKLRLWGSIGFIVCSIGVGALIDIFDVPVVLIASLMSLALLYMASLFVLTPTATDAKIADGGDWKKALNFVFIIFLIANMLLQVSFGAYYNFFALYMNDLGYSGLNTGVFIAVGVVAEVFIFIFAARLLRNFNIMNMLAFSILLTALRWWVLGNFAEYPALIVLSQIIHALSFGLTHTASVYFLSQYFSKSFQSRAQALYVSIAFGVGGASGSLMSGLFWQDGEGAIMSFNVSAIIALIAGLMLAMLSFYLLNNKHKHADN